MKAEFDYIDLGGGVNRGISADRIPSRQAARLTNFYPYGTHLVRRGGHRMVIHDSSFFANYGPVNGMVAYSPVIGTWELLLGATSQFARQVGSGLVILPITGEAAVNSADGPSPWTTVQYKQYTYWFRKNLDGRFYRVNSDRAARAGITAPTGAPAIATGAAGVITAGDYRAVYTYYNTLTAKESNPSPVSNTLVHPGALQINYTGITVSTDPFVTARRIYRTIPDQVGVYFFIGQINDNATTTFTGDNVAVADLGRPVSFDNGVPPDDLYVGEIWNERLFATDGVDVFFSEFLLPECFGEESSISVYPDDGHTVTALRAFGDRLIIGKTNAIHHLTGTDARNFAPPHTNRHGCASQASMKWSRATCSGSAWTRPSTARMAPRSEDPRPVTVSESDRRRCAGCVCAAVLPERTGTCSVWTTMPLQVDGPDLLIYGYKGDTWTNFNTMSLVFTGSGSWSSSSTWTGSTRYTAALKGARTAATSRSTTSPRLATFRIMPRTRPWRMCR
jgi:hypothetical protein